MGLFGAIGEYFWSVVIPVTVIVILISIFYTLRNILNIWNAGKTNLNKETTNDAVDQPDDESTDERKPDENVQTKKMTEPEIDPVQYCEHIQSQVKKARQRVATKEIQQNLTAEEIENEREIQRKQIEDIFKLMEQNSEKFGVTSEEEMLQQMRLYV